MTNLEAIEKATEQKFCKIFEIYVDNIITDSKDGASPETRFRKALTALSTAETTAKQILGKESDEQHNNQSHG